VVSSQWKREDLVEDERSRGFPAVTKYGPYIFVSGSDGHRDPATERISVKFADDATAQCRNSYSRIAARLEKAGYSGDCAVWIQNYTSGQQWRLERMGLWPDYFGEEQHTRAVSFGAQSRMHGINMLTTIALAIDPAVAREALAPSPGRGRASRMTRVGPFLFVIGVRGHEQPGSGSKSPQETPEAFGVQLQYCWETIESYLRKAGATLQNFVRVDAALRGARFIAQFDKGTRALCGGKMPFAGTPFGVPLGARCEQEIGGIAVAPGEAATTRWLPWDGTQAESVEAGGLLFLSKVSGVADPDSGKTNAELLLNMPAQVRNALANIDQVLERAGSSPDRLLRLDVYVRDIYAADEILQEIKAVLGSATPTLSFIGADTANGAELEITAIAGSR
jgi:enamine deaminase RidA (YjgF/YER057c/UK114 family)